MRWMRNAWMVRKRLHVKGDVMCTVLLLLLFCLLLYVHQVLLSSGWDRTTWRLEIQGSTSSSRALLGAPTRTRSSIIKAQRVSSNSIDQQSPPCQPQEPKFISNVITNPNPQSELKSPVKPNQQTKGKLKAWRKNTAPTKATDPRPTLPLFDFEGYLREKDNRDFKLLIDQPEKCIVGKDKAAGARDGGSSTSPYMLIAVKSVAADFDKRQVVRRTWGKEGLFQNDVAVRTVFLLGVPRNRSALPLWDRLLAYESEAFKDILLWDFEDTFFNLTLKETNFLQWVNASCHNVRFIFKGDADVYVNIENILEMLQGKKNDEDLFIGDIIVHAKPIRRRSSKYYVPEFIYGASLYPSYAGGGGFVMSGYTARRLSAACQQVELFPIDDVFLGMCLQQIGVKPLRHDGFRTFGIPRPSAAPHLQTFDPCFYRDLMVVHSLNVPQIWLMWKLLHDPKLSCHSRRYGTPRPFRWRGRLGGDGGEEEENAQTETDYSFKVFVKHY